MSRPNHFTIHPNASLFKIPKLVINPIQQFIDNYKSKDKAKNDIYLINDKGNIIFIGECYTVTMNDLKRKFMLQNFKLTGRYGRKIK